MNSLDSLLTQRLSYVGEINEENRKSSNLERNLSSLRGNSTVAPMPNKRAMQLEEKIQQLDLKIAPIQNPQPDPRPICGGRFFVFESDIPQEFVRNPAERQENHPQEDPRLICGGRHQVMERDVPQEFVRNPAERKENHHQEEPIRPREEQNVNLEIPKHVEPEHIPQPAAKENGWSWKTVALGVTAAVALTALGVYYFKRRQTSQMTEPNLPPQSQNLPPPQSQNLPSSQGNSKPLPALSNSKSIYSYFRNKCTAHYDNLSKKAKATAKFWYSMWHSEMKKYKNLEDWLEKKMKECKDNSDWKATVWDVYCYAVGDGNRQGGHLNNTRSHSTDVRSFEHAFEWSDAQVIQYLQGTEANPFHIPR